MKYVVLTGALALALCTGICEAADEKAKVTSDPAAVTQKSDANGGLKHIDLGDEPVTRVGTMSEGESYSENTGFPNVVKSDGDMDI